jgi:hypothetical protein
MSKINQLIPWKDLLSQWQFEDVSSEYGQNSQAVANAFDVLGQIQWMNMVGTQFPRGVEVEKILSWKEALTPIMEDNNYGMYNFTGHLIKPSEQIDQVFLEVPRYRIWWEKARADVNDYYDYSPYIPQSLSSEQAEFLWEYLYEYISLLLAEIIVSEVVKNTTYFRELLSWFNAGFFPCGWIGNWPEGKLRVF